jgi:signal peptidase I
MDNTTVEHPIDSRIGLYRSALIILVALLAGAFVKFFLFDTVRIDSSHMNPAIQHGDRVLFTRALALPFIKPVRSLRRNAVVVFSFPHRTKAIGCLRVGAIGGDSIHIVDGQLYNLTQPQPPKSSPPSAEELVPAEYTPRDNFAPYYLPQRGDSVIFEQLSARDLILCASMILQENPGEPYRLQPRLYIDDSLSNDYIISGFPLYQGHFDSIAEATRLDWFFWDRLQEHLRQSLSDRQVTISFALLHDNHTVTRYRFKDNYAFLIADNWSDGYDSRYLGPVGSNKILGSVKVALWSFSTANGSRSLQFQRIGRFIH